MADGSANRFATWEAICTRAVNRGEGPLRMWWFAFAAGYHGESSRPPTAGFLLAAWLPAVGLPMQRASCDAVCRPVGDPLAVGLLLPP